MVQGNVHQREIILPNIKEEVIPEQPKKVSRQTRKNQKRVFHINRGYVVFLAIATAAALIMCVKYLQLQSEISNRSRNIAQLQQEVAELREDNTARYNAALNSVNLEEVREKAMNEFGMVYASPEQIIKYKSPTTNTVTQYESIPKDGVVADSNKMEK